MEIGRSSMRKVTVLAVIATLALLMGGASEAYADPPGNNGTVKIHAEPGNHAEPTMANEPHVCLFHIHGFNFDANATGQWHIEAWAPTSGGTGIGTTSWGPANAAGEWQTGTIHLNPGHYKLFWKQTQPSTPGGDKQKVFWVECGETPGGGSGGATGSTGSTGSSAGGNGNGNGQGNGNAGGNGNASGNGNENGNAGGNGNGNGNSSGNVNAGGSVSGGTTLTSGAAVSASAQSGVVAGSQSAPQITQSGQGVVQGVQSLPSTSTDTSHTPLVVLGMVILATGVVLLRRPAIAPNP
jgi:LPXTG-motif cell wall-anchored protein